MGVKFAKQGHRVTVDESAARANPGLGDMVETVAKPIGKVMGLSNCAGCQRRKAALNAAGRRAGSRIRNFFRRR